MINYSIQLIDTISHFKAHKLFSRKSQRSTLILLWILLMDRVTDHTILTGMNGLNYPIVMHHFPIPQLKVLADLFPSLLMSKIILRHLPQIKQIWAQTILCSLLIIRNNLVWRSSQSVFNRTCLIQQLLRWFLCPTRMHGNQTLPMYLVIHFLQMDTISIWSTITGHLNNHATNQSITMRINRFPLVQYVDCMATPGINVDQMDTIVLTVATLAIDMKDVHYAWIPQLLPQAYGTGDASSPAIQRSNCNTSPKIPKKLKSNIKIGHLNIRSIVNKITELENIIKTNSFDIFCITESWLNDYVSDNDVNIDGYVLLRRDRPAHAGGVCLFVKSHLKFKSRSDIACSNVEIICIELFISDCSPILLCCVYCPTFSNIYYDELVQLLNCTLNGKTEAILIGDFNFDILDTSSAGYRRSLELCNLFHFEQLIDKPTRVNNVSKSLIDHIYTTIPGRHTESGILEYTLSDHYLTYTVLRSKSIKKDLVKKIDKLCYKRFNISHFKEELCKQLIYSHVTHGNLTWKSFSDTFLSTSNKHAPIRSYRLRTKSSQWLTPSIKQLMHKRDAIHKLASIYNDPLLISKYRTLRNLVTSSIHKSKQMFFNTHIQNASPSSVQRTHISL